MWSTSYAVCTAVCLGAQEIDHAVIQADCGGLAGGVSKEFFQLLVRAIFAADYGMFELNEVLFQLFFALDRVFFTGSTAKSNRSRLQETREFWFSPAALDMGATPTDFRLVGIVLGLGIFNGVILDVHLPLVAYKKLLNGEPTFEDLEDASPSLARGLRALLDYDGDDVEDVFCRTFEVEYKLFDTVRSRFRPACTAAGH